FYFGILIMPSVSEVFDVGYPYVAVS
ncbi:UNVERIFIED_ORG: hypothetical protein J2X79_001961, partial [Arthrobacter globiformis]|nr:hypothetical protein [Arthrobacter globiformis]